MKKMLLPLLLFAVLNAKTQELSQWRGIDRDGFYHETGLLKEWPENGPELLWHFDGLGVGHGSSAVINDSVFVAGTENDDGFIVALNTDGHVLWKSIYGKEWIDGYEGVRTTPAYIDGNLYLMSGVGTVYCLKASDGSLVWQVDLLNQYDGRNIKWGMTENLLIDGNKIYCTPGGEINNVIALNRLTGDLIWSCSGRGEISAYCSPALVEHNGRKLVVTHTEKSILGIDADTGSLLWTVDQPNKYSVHANTPVYRNGWLYCVSGYGKGGVMLELSKDGESVREVWRNEDLDNKLGGVVVLDGKIYGSGDFNRSWYCLDWYTGEVLYSASKFKKGNIISAEGLLYWYTQGGNIALVEALQDSFVIKGSFRVPFGEKQHWAHLVIHNKRLYVRHGGSLMVYSLKASKGFSEWRGLGRTGVYTNEKGLLEKWPEEGPAMIWYNDTIPDGYSSVAIANDQIYTTGVRDENDVVIAFDLDGNVQWEKPYGRKWDSTFDRSRSTPTVEGDRLFVSSGYGDIACLDAITGDLIWQVPASENFHGTYGKWGIAESILIADDKIIYTPGGDSTTMVALNKETGETVWQSKSLQDNPSYTSPLLIDHNGTEIICTVTENYFIGIRPADGELLWQFNFGEYAGGSRKTNIQINTPLYHEGSFFVTNGYDHQSVKVSLDENNKPVLDWVDSNLDVHHGGVVLLDGYIYGANWESNRNGYWTCLDWESGEVKYSTEWENKGSIIAADGHLYCYEEKSGNLALVPANPDKFEVSSSFEVPYGNGPHWAHPVIEAGRLYIRHGTALMVYDIRK